MTMDGDGSTAGPPHPLEGLIAQNAVTFADVTSGNGGEQHDPRQQ